MRSTITKSIKQAKYTAAVAVTGAWKENSRHRLYEELLGVDVQQKVISKNVSFFPVEMIKNTRISAE